MDKEEIKNEFINCIEGSHTLNLAISVLEDREELKMRINKSLSFIDSCMDSLSVNEVNELKKKLRGNPNEI